MGILIVRIITILLVAGLSGKSVYASDGRFDVLKAPKPLPKFSLMDQNSAAFTGKNLVDQWTLMFLGFTTCPDVCPMTLMKLAHVVEKLKACVAEPLVPEVILLAVDPKRDKQNLRKGYLDSFGSHNTAITGDWEQIDILVDGLGGTYKFQNTHTGEHAGHHGYDVIHTTAVYVINPEGAVVGTMGMPWKASAAVNFLGELMSDNALASTSDLNTCVASTNQP